MEKKSQLSNVTKQSPARSTYSPMHLPYLIPLPQFALRVDDKGDIYAEGVDELLYGRLSNVL